MTSIDDRIRGSLDADDAAFLASLEQEPGMFRQLGDTLHGPMGRWTAIVYLGGLVATGLIAWAVIGMLRATDTRSLVLWTALAGAGLLAVGMLKLWVFARMNTLTILRELKRIELRVANIERF